MIWFFLIGLSLLAYSFYPIIHQGIYLPDFILYYYPTGSQLSQGLNPYHLPTGLLYSPPALLFFRLLDYLPPQPTQLIWTLLSFLALLLSLWLIIKLTKLKPSRKWFLLLSPFFFLSFPAKFTLGMGQINHFILLLFTASFYFYQQKKKNLSAIFLTLSFLIKLFPVWTFLFFIYKKDWGYIKKIILYSFSAFLISLIFLPLQIFKDYFTFVLPGFLTHTANSSYYNQALTGLISRFISHPPLQAALATFLSLILVFLAWKKLKSRLSNNLKFSLFITLSLLINPVSWQHHLVFLFFPFIILFTRFYSQKNTRGLSLTFLAYLLIFINIKNPQPFTNTIWGNLLLSHATIGNLLIFIATLF